MHKYPYIRAWGQIMGSHAYYINDRIEDAQLDGAPENAVYLCSHKYTTLPSCDKPGPHWVTVDEIVREDTRARLHKIVREM